MRRMKVLAVSDVHFEFHADDGASLLAELDADVDVVVIAGDLSVAPKLFEALRFFREKFERVVYVPGNHDWFHTTRSGMARIRERVERDLPGVFWLDRDVVEICGQRFVGTTLWFPDSKAAERWQNNMPDFAYIEGFADWFGEEFEKNREFLAENVRSGDFVITHHLPTRRSIADKYVNHPLNCYFVGNVEDIVRDAGARYWVHGHTHESCDYIFGRTRVIANPLGYPKKPNREFRERMFLDA